MKRLISDLPKPSVGVNRGEGSQATAVVKLLKEGGTLLTLGKSLPQEVSYPGAEKRPLKWNDFLKGKKLNVQSLWLLIRPAILEPPWGLLEIKNSNCSSWSGYVQEKIRSKWRQDSILSDSTWKSEWCVEGLSNGTKPLTRLVLSFNRHSGMAYRALFLATTSWFI